MAWRTHSCVPCSHSCEQRFAIGPRRRSHECERGTLRACATIRAYLLGTGCDLPVEIGESAAILREAGEQRCGRPQIGTVLLFEIFDAIENLAEAHGVGVKHGTAAPRREAVSVQVHDIDVHGAQREAFAQQLRAFVDQREQAAIDDFFATMLLRWMLASRATASISAAVSGSGNGLRSASYFENPLPVF